MCARVYVCAPVYVCVFIQSHASWWVATSTAWVGAVMGLAAVRWAGKRQAAMNGRLPVVLYCAVLLHDDEADVLLAPIGDSSGGAGFIVVRQAILGQLT